MSGGLVIPNFPQDAEGRHVCPSCLTRIGSKVKPAVHWIAANHHIDNADYEAAMAVARGMADEGGPTGPARREGTMGATKEAPASAGKLEKFVSDAVRAAGGKVADLTDEQRGRAESPPDGLRGKALGRFVLEGGTAAGTPGNGGASKAEEAAAELARLDERVSKSTGHTAADQKKARALAKAAGADVPAWAATGGAAKASGSNSGGGSQRAKYPEAVREAVRAVYDIKGSKDGSPGPKQHVHVRAVVAKAVGKKEADVSKADVVKASGFGSYAALKKAARPEKKGGASREELKAIRPLADKMGDDAFCKGRNLAAILVAWADQA